MRGTVTPSNPKLAHYYLKAVRIACCRIIGLLCRLVDRFLKQLIGLHLG